MAQILPFIRSDYTFDPETTAMLGTVYDSALKELSGRAELPIVREVIAKRIVDLASKGERNPELLRKAALIALAPAE